MERDSLEHQNQSTKITDLNLDCLEQIFGDFDLRDLFNVAISNVWLRVAARSIYARKFSAKTVVIDIYGSFRVRTLNSSTPAQTACWITIHDLRTCLQFLRCFGRTITKLQIGYYQSYINHYDHVEQYVNEYCSESLISISYFHKSDFPSRNFHVQRPFIRTERVHISHIDLDIQLTPFVEWFPNLRSLELYASRVDHHFTGAAFQYLKHLIIKIYSRYVIDYSLENVFEFLRINPQLKSLNISITAQISSSTMLAIIRNNSLLSELIMATGIFCLNINASEINQLAREHPLLEHADLTRFQMSADDAVSLIRQLSSLHHFRFILGNHTEYDYLMQHLRPEWQSTISHGWFDDIRSIITLKRRSEVDSSM